VADVRWKQEREEIIDLVYRVQADHGGNLAEREARKFGPWAPDAIKRAKKIRWLVAKGSPPILSVTNKGAKALDAALASRDVAVPQPHWFGGSIVSVQSPTGPVLPPQSYKPYEELKRRAFEHGLLTREDIDRVASAKRKEPEEPEGYRTLHEQIFPGTRGFAVALEYEEGHPLGGGMLDPAGHEGAYQVTATLTRRGAPNVPSVYVTDPYMMEGDSHLQMPELRGEGDAVAVPFIVYSGEEGEEIWFELVANRQSRLGQIRTTLRADSVEDARRKAYRLLNPFYCDLSYRYDVPVEVLQINVAELATLTAYGTKEDDFREKVFRVDEFIGEHGLNYGELHLYEFFTRLYREATNSSSMDYGFLCFFRIAEGVIELRRRAIIEREGKRPEEVPRSSVLADDEVIEGEEASDLFPAEQMGESLWTAFKRLEEDRTKVGHAFMYSENPLEGHTDIIAERIEAEERAGTRRAQARYIARRLMDSMYFYSNESAEDSEE
jgi:hypothetical protein